MKSIFKEGELVRYVGDLTSNEYIRQKESTAEIDIIDDDKHPYIGIRLIPSNKLISVPGSLLQSIHTKKEHLLNLGFEEIIIDESSFYKKGSLNVVGIVIYPKARHAYFAGFRVVPSIPFSLDIERYLDDKREIVESRFGSDFASVETLYELIRISKEKGFFQNEEKNDLLRRAMGSDQ